MRPMRLSWYVPPLKNTVVEHILFIYIYEIGIQFGGQYEYGGVGGNLSILTELVIRIK